MLLSLDSFAQSSQLANQEFQLEMPDGTLRYISFSDESPVYTQGGCLAYATNYVNGACLSYEQVLTNCYSCDIPVYDDVCVQYQNVYGDGACLNWIDLFGTPVCIAYEQIVVGQECVQYETQQVGTTCAWTMCLENGDCQEYEQVPVQGPCTQYENVLSGFAGTYSISMTSGTSGIITGNYSIDLFDANSSAGNVLTWSNAGNSAMVVPHGNWSYHTNASGFFFSGNVLYTDNPFSAMDGNYNSGTGQIIRRGCSDSEACNYINNPTYCSSCCLYVAPGDCDCDGNEVDALGVCGGSCATDLDADGICDSQDYLIEWQFGDNLWDALRWAPDGGVVTLPSGSLQWSMAISNDYNSSGAGNFCKNLTIRGAVNGDGDPATSWYRWNDGIAWNFDQSCDGKITFENIDFSGEYGNNGVTLKGIDGAFDNCTFSSNDAFAIALPDIGPTFHSLEVSNCKFYGSGDLDDVGIHLESNTWERECVVSNCLFMDLKNAIRSDCGADLEVFESAFMNCGKHWENNVLVYDYWSVDGVNDDLEELVSEYATIRHGECNIAGSGTSDDLLVRDCIFLNCAVGVSSAGYLNDYKVESTYLGSCGIGIEEGRGAVGVFDGNVLAGNEIGIRSRSSYINDCLIIDNHVALQPTQGYVTQFPEYCSGLEIHNSALLGNEKIFLDALGSVNEISPWVAYLDISNSVVASNNHNDNVDGTWEGLPDWCPNTDPGINISNVTWCDNGGIVTTMSSSGSNHIEMVCDCGDSDYRELNVSSWSDVLASSPTLNGQWPDFSLYYDLPHNHLVPFVGCTNSSSCSFEPVALYNDCNCVFPDAIGVCGGACADDLDSDGICDDVDDCVGAYDALGVCGGACAVDADSDGVCDDVDDCVGAYDDCGVCNGSGAIYGCGCADIPEGDCDCDGNMLDALDVCGGSCTADADSDGICDDVDDCVGVYDACGVCNGPGAVYECGCADIPEGDCDCDGNVLDAIGVCGGACAADADSDGICDDVDDCVGAYDSCGVCNGPGEIYECGCADIPEGDCDCDGNVLDALDVCGGSCTADADRDGTCDDVDDCVGAYDDCGVCNGSGAIYECGCADIPEGDCDCDGNVLDALDVCGGLCTADADSDGICDDVDDCVGAYDSCGVCNGPGAVYECGCADIPEGDCDCDGNVLDAIGVCGGACAADADSDGICDDVDDCVGVYDACGVCNGSGAIYECGCADIPEGDCDCDGNVLDAIGVCGGACTSDADSDGICDDVDDCVGAYDECGICNGPGAIYECGCADIPEGDCDCDGNQEDVLGECGGDCTADADADGICDDVDDCVGAYDECGVCNGPGSIYECGCADIPDGDCDCDGNVLDECGVCGGDGIAEGACDCDGNQLDAIGVCGGYCLMDINQNGICDPDDIPGCTYTSALNFDVNATVDIGNCEFEDQSGSDDELCVGDLSNDGFVGIDDILMMLSLYDTHCE